MTKRHLLPLAAMERLLKNAGAYRVSEDAKSALRDILEEYSQVLGEEAIKLAKHAGRKTVRATDIKLAQKTN
ncbi:histone family protein [Candidatus Woesearchaeota archaeon]|nr:MAG: histone family protein [Candidatus Woesearchaeota archaeon]